MLQNKNIEQLNRYPLKTSFKMPSRSTSSSSKKTRSTSNLQKNAGGEKSLQHIVLYVLETCPYCHNAMQLLENASLKFTKIVVSSEEKEKSKVKAKTGMQTFPMIFVQSTDHPESYLRIGGRDNLVQYMGVRQKLLDGDIQMDVLHALLR